MSVVGVLAALVVLPGFAGASAGGPYDSVDGSGWRGTPANPDAALTHFAVSAKDGPQGIFGTYRSQNPDNAALNFTGDVTCLNISGDHALVGGIVTRGGDLGQAGTGFAVGFIDNPSPIPDTVTLTDIFIPVPVDCQEEAFLFTDAPVLPFVRGNVEVNDAP
jgi:hypothetical protein